MFKITKLLGAQQMFSSVCDLKSMLFRKKDAGLPLPEGGEGLNSWSWFEPLVCLQGTLPHCPVAQSELSRLAPSKMVLAAHKTAETTGRVSLGKLQPFQWIGCPECPCCSGFCLRRPCSAAMAGRIQDCIQQTFVECLPVSVMHLRSREVDKQHSHRDK